MMSETIIVITLVVQTLFAGVLAWATIRLAKHTNALARLTKELVLIEERREERIRHEAKLRDTEIAYDLAEEILKVNYGEFGAFLYPKIPTHPNLQLIKKMALQRESFQDSDALKYLDELLIAIRLVEEGSALGEEDRLKAMDVYQHFQTRLKAYEVDRWRDQLTSRAST